MEDSVSTGGNPNSYSEIDYFFSSNLSETTWGIDRIMQRIILFEKSKRHIPYLLLIYLTLYNPLLDIKDKRETLEKLVAELYRSQIRKAGRNPLLDFISPYFVVELLHDLFIMGINVKDLIRNLKVNVAENPVFDLARYGNHSKQGFPEAVVFFIDRLGNPGDNRDDHLLEISASAMRAGNFPGFQFTMNQIKGKATRFKAQNLLAVAHVERKEITAALKIVESITDFREKCFA